MRIFGREPTVILQTVSALLAIVVTFQMEWLTADQQVAIVAFLSAVLGAINAASVRPVAPAAFIAVATTGAALLTGYGLDLRPELVGSITAAVPVLLTLLTRVQVTPIESPARPLPTV